MEFKLTQQKKKKVSENAVSVPVETLDEIISILSDVECTCVWSPIDNQYIKVSDIPSSLVEELKVIRKLSAL